MRFIVSDHRRSNDHLITIVDDWRQVIDVMHSDVGRDSLTPLQERLVRDWLSQVRIVGEILWVDDNLLILTSAFPGRLQRLVTIPSDRIDRADDCQLVDL